MSTTIKPPLGPMPHSVWIYNRIVHIMRAIIRYEDAGITVPYEWIDEVCLLLDKHRTSERLTTSGNVSYQKYASKDTANASMDAMRQAIKGAKEHGGNHISFNIKDLENTLDGIQKAINHE